MPPPLSMRFGTLASIFGVFFGVSWGALMWLWRGRSEWSSLLGLAVGSTVAGLLFGLWMARYYKRRAQDLGLPSWEEYERRLTSS
jgi:uncharacterized membrane protein YfcA